MKTKLLDIIYCKDCRSCSIKKINNQSVLYSCNKDDYVDPYIPELYCNKKCFTRKFIKRNKENNAKGIN